MIMVDFEYDGLLLSDFDCVPAVIDTTSEDPTPLGIEPEISTFQVDDVNLITSIKYEDVITKTFDVIKTPCRTTGEYNEAGFNDIDISRISKWLQQKKYLKFRPIYDTEDFPDLVFYGTFSVKAIYIQDMVIGFTLTFTSNAPYGFSDPETIFRTVDAANNTFEIYNNSQEIGYIYPDEVVITCHGNGTIHLTNTKDYVISKDGKELISTIIKNCVDGEVITLYCKSKIILSSREGHTSIYNDFNYVFPRLITEVEEEDNIFVFETSLGVTGLDIEFTHSPVRKVGVI